MMPALVRRAIASIPVIFGVLTLTFLLIHFVPGDPVDVMLGENASPIEREALREELGLNAPVLDQFISFLSKLLKGDLGRSLFSRRPVIDEIFERLPATVELTLAAMIVALTLGIPLGVLAAAHKTKTIDKIILGFGLAGISVPSFWLAPMLILFFSIWLGWLPVSERSGIESLILPAISLGFSLSSILIRMTRAAMLEVLKEDYITVARSKGLSKPSVLLKHALKNALVPIITIVGLQIGALLTGTVITETIFDWPGLGTLFYRAIQQRDYPMVQGCVLVIAFIYVAVNFLTDVCYAWANPKMRAT